jgi:Carboxypeptidase regulatory-like domain
MRLVKSLFAAMCVVALSGSLALAGGKGGKNHHGPSTQPSGIGSIHGTVTGQDGKPAAGVAVEVHQPGTPKPHRAIAVTRTGPDGSYSFSNVPATRLQVRAGGQGVGYATKRVEVSAGATSEASVMLAPLSAKKHKHGGTTQPSVK